MRRRGAVTELQLQRYIMSGKGFAPNEIERVRRAIAELQGVHSCRIDTDDHGGIARVRLESQLASPALISRVRRIVADQLGVDVDSALINVVDADSSAEESSETVYEFPVVEYPSRFRFQSVNLFVSSDNVMAEVELIRDGVETFGRAESDKPASCQMNVVAEATLRAVSEILDDDVRLCLSDVAEVKLGKDSAIVTRVEFVRDRNTKSLAGCSLFTVDTNQTIVFATLDAVNRILGIMQSRRSVEYDIE